MRLCLNKLKDEGDDTVEDLCTALLPAVVGVGFAKHNMRQFSDDSDSDASASRSSASASRSSASGSRSSATSSKSGRRSSSKKARKNIAQESVSQAALALTAHVERRDNTSAVSDRAKAAAQYSQAIGTHMSTLMALMDKRQTSDPAGVAIYDGMIADIQDMIAHVKRQSSAN